MTKKQKFEKEAMKKAKEDQAKWKYDMEKKHEKYNSAVARRKVLDAEVYEKLHSVEDK